MTEESAKITEREHRKHILSLMSMWGLDYPKKKCRTKSRDEFTGRYLCFGLEADAKNAYTAALEALSEAQRLGKAGPVKKHLREIIRIWDSFTYRESVTDNKGRDWLKRIITEYRKKGEGKMNLKQAALEFVAETRTGIRFMATDESYLVGTLDADFYTRAAELLAGMQGHLEAVTMDMTEPAKAFFDKIIGAASVTPNGLMVFKDGLGEWRDKVYGKMRPPGALERLEGFASACKQWAEASDNKAKKIKLKGDPLPPAVDNFRRYMRGKHSGIAEALSQLRAVSDNHFGRAEKQLRDMEEKIAAKNREIAAVNTESREYYNRALNGDIDKAEAGAKINSNKKKIAGLEREIEVITPRLGLLRAAASQHDGPRAIIDEILFYWDVSEYHLAPEERGRLFADFNKPEIMALINNPQSLEQSSSKLFIISESIIGKVKEYAKVNENYQRLMQKYSGKIEEETVTADGTKRKTAREESLDAFEEFGRSLTGDSGADGGEEIKEPEFEDILPLRNPRKPGE